MAELHVREPRHAMIGARSFCRPADTGENIRVTVDGFPEVANAHQEKHVSILAFQFGMLCEKVSQA